MKSVKPMMMLALAASACFSIPHAATADGHIGNGGGSWTCRSNGADDSLIWVQLVDLSEARREYNQNVPFTPLPYAGTGKDGEILAPQEWLAAGNRYLSWAETKMQQANPAFYAEYLRRKMDLLKNRILVPAASEFDRTSDILHHTRPDDSSCVGGYLLQEPEQLANFTDMGKLEINGKLWFSSSLSEIDRAALFVHEVLYWMFRDFAHDTDSMRTRVIVGYLFSASIPVTEYSSMLTLAPQPSGAPGLPLRYGMFAEITGHWMDMEVNSYNTATGELQLTQRDRDDHWSAKVHETFKCSSHGAEYVCPLVKSTRGNASEWSDRYIRIIDPSNFVWVKLRKNGSIHHATHYSKVN